MPFHKHFYITNKKSHESPGYNGEIHGTYSFQLVDTDKANHGATEFRGLHNTNDVLRLSARQHEVFSGQKQPDEPEKRRKASEVFPEYYILKVNDFDKVASTRLDEWMEFLKTGQIASDATAPGLAEARLCLDMDTL